MMTNSSMTQLEYSGDQHSSSTVSSRLLNVIPKHLKTSAVLHLVIVLGLLTSVAVVTRSILGTRSFNDMIDRQQLLSQNMNNCSVVEYELEALKNATRRSEEEDQLGGESEVAPGGVIRGYILSSKLDKRYNSSMKVLKALNIEAERVIPFPWDSERVDKALEGYAGSRVFNTERFLRSYSNQLTFVNTFRRFVNDRSAKLDSWRFFFENDIALHPSVSEEDARDAILEGMELAAGDGMLYLGICGPRNCVGKTQLSTGLEASRCVGCCTHAFGFTKWKAAGFLSVRRKLKFLPKVNGIHMDLVFMRYSNNVHQTWYLGSSLKSPVKSVRDHFGMLYQDRNHYNSTITPPS